MARIVAGFASSHSPMLMSELDDWEVNFGKRDATRPHLDLEGRPATFEQLVALAPADAAERIARPKLERRHAATRAALARLRQDIAHARLDTLIVVGDDQEEMFGDANMPAFGIWYGETIPNGPAPKLSNPTWQDRAWAHYLEAEHAADYKCNAALALHLINALGDTGFDPTVCRAMPEGTYEGHAFSFVHRVLETRVPMVPVFLNTFYPPNQPSPRRCFNLGRAVRQAVEAFPGNQRIGVLASGGLSHFVVDEELDQGVIQALQNRDYEWLQALPLNKLLSGNSEIRNWICLAGMLGDTPLNWIEYVPGYRSLALTGTGLCFAHWRA